MRCLSRTSLQRDKYKSQVVVHYDMALLY